MKNLILVIFSALFIVSCTDNKREDAIKDDNRIALHTDTLNVVKLTDTLVIYESTCRGCAYEGSTNFEISDTLGLIKLYNVITEDNNPSDMDGGSISKTLVLVPTKIGTTTFKLYKFWKQERTAEDSARFSSYSIEVKN
ncbi:MAG: hypothetical protein ABIP79_16195 [Chitinophagaceae bacterium]